MGCNNGPLSTLGPLNQTLSHPTSPRSSGQGLCLIKHEEQASEQTAALPLYHFFYSIRISMESERTSGISAMRQGCTQSATRQGGECHDELLRRNRLADDAGHVARHHLLGALVGGPHLGTASASGWAICSTSHNGTERPISSGDPRASLCARRDRSRHLSARCVNSCKHLARPAWPADPSLQRFL